MKNRSQKCLVDTNVPVTANLSVNPDSIPTELAQCVLACVRAIEDVISRKILVLDNGNEILDEYRHNLHLSGQPGIGDGFLKWFHDNQGQINKVEKITINREGDSYEEFPSHPGLVSVDISDRKFVAVAHAHPAKPPILQATDSKWWGWKEALNDVGIVVDFLCPSYIEAKYREKMERG